MSCFKPDDRQSSASSCNYPTPDINDKFENADESNIHELNDAPINTSLSKISELKLINVINITNKLKVEIRAEILNEVNVSEEYCYLRKKMLI